MDDVFARYQGALRTGHQLAGAGRHKEALAQYEEAARVAGARALPHVFVGSMLVRLGRPADAVAAYERALSVEPDHLDALSGRAAALLAAGRRTEAQAAQHDIHARREAPVVPPAPTGLQTPIARSESLAVEGERALDAGKRGEAIDAWLEESREHAAAQHYDAALDAALRALAVDTGATRVHLELARAYAQRGWHDEATDHVAALRRLLELAPDDAAAQAVTEIEWLMRPPQLPAPA